MRFNPDNARQLREAAYPTGMSACVAVGISRQALAAIESGASVPSAETLGRMAEAYGASVDAFYTSPDPTAEPARVGAVGSE